jgi:hypothetical protein
MITFKTAPQGTATVTEAHAQSMRDQFAALKPLKPTKIKAHARRFPHPNGFWSTEDYIRQYFALNSYMKIAAYGAHTDHVSLYHPLPDRVARFNPAEPEVEGS